MACHTALSPTRPSLGTGHLQCKSKSPGATRANQLRGQAETQRDGKEQCPWTTGSSSCQWAMLGKVPTAPVGVCGCWCGFKKVQEKPCPITQQQQTLRNPVKTRTGGGCKPHQNKPGTSTLSTGLTPAWLGQPCTDADRTPECNQRIPGFPYLSWKRRRASCAQIRMRPSTGNVSRGLSASKIPLTHRVISRGE